MSTANGTQPTDPDGLTINVDPSATVLTTFLLGRDLGVISISDYNGKRALDLRRFYFNDVSWCPTAKGIRIPIESAPAVIEALIDHLRAGAIR